MLKIRITVNSNSFDFDGETPFPDVRPLIELWFTAIDEDLATQRQIDRGMTRLKASNDRLAATIAAHTPSA